MAALDDLRLDGRVALVTGGASPRGIGRAISRRLAAAGAQVVVADLDAVGACETAELCGREGLPGLGVELDVTNEASVEAAFGRAVERFGTVHILVNNAGISRSTPAWEIEPAEFDEMIAVNLRGGFLCARAAMPLMMRQRWGRLVWLASVAGKQGGGVFGSAHYAASKAAVIGLCQGLARQLGPLGITSNAVAPGLIDTEIAARTMAPGEFASWRERIVSGLPARRIGTPEDVAAAVHYLCTNAASYITGEIVDINGGMYFD
jgi:NAD(P)-dependent dehydrogenase (short-subunit alcohol dehydrogenase family)